jgi:DNA-binding Lrp family transcriptional regulator
MLSRMKSSELDALDRAVVHALTLDGRAAFSTISTVLGVSEHTVARRYRRLRSHGVLRVVGILNGVRLGYKSWTIRIRCTPDAAMPISTALARRPDTFWIYILSGGTEIACNSQPRTPDELLIDKLPRGRSVLDVSAHELISDHAAPPHGPVSGPLDDDQAARLCTPEPALLDEPVRLDAADHRVLAVLARDGRATFAELANAVGDSSSTAARRLQYLRATGALAYKVELSPAALGMHTEARLWMSVRPRALVSTAAALATHAEVTFAAVTTGPTNLVAQLACPDSGSLYRYVTGQVAGLTAVDSIETAPVLRTVKRFGLPL